MEKTEKEEKELDEKMEEVMQRLTEKAQKYLVPSTYILYFYITIVLYYHDIILSS